MSRVVFPGFLLVSLLSAPLFVGGCGDPNASLETIDTNSVPEDPFEEQANERNKEVFVTEEDEEIDRSRTSFEGLWKLVMYRPEGQNSPKLLKNTLFICEITKNDEGGYDGVIPNDDPMNPQTDIKVQVEGNRLNFTAELPLPDSEKKPVLRMEGVLTNGIVLGNFLGPQQRPNLIAMLATKQRLTSPTAAKQVEHFEEFAAAAQSNDAEIKLAEFAAKYPENPYTHNAYATILRLSTIKQLDEKFLDEQMALFKSFSAKFGTRLEKQATLSISSNLTSSHRYPDLALKYFNEFQASLTKEQRESNTQFQEAILDLIKTDRAILDLEGDQKEEAYQTLLELLKKTPYESRIIHTLAQYAKDQGKTEEAIKLFGTLATLPTLEESLITLWRSTQIKNEVPSKVFLELWKSKHGSQEGIEQFQAKIYQDFLDTYTLEAVEPKPVDGQRRKVLCEYFTGTPCIPCIAPSVSIQSVLEAYPQEEFITLSYHAHAAGPDPLANSTSQNRFDRYGKTFYPEGRYGMPLVTFNGKQIPFTKSMMVGNLAGIEFWQKNFVEELDKQRGEKSQIKIKLTADAAEGKLNLSAKVTGIVTPATNLRLRMAIAEDQVDFVSLNKLRQQHMVVRMMPGGLNGIKPEEDTISYEKSLSLVDMKQDLMDNIDAFQQQSDFEFPSLPPMYLKKLSFVAFVQKEDTNEILQAEIIPVSGELDYGDLDEEPPTAEPATVKPTEEATAAEQTKTTEEKPETEPQPEEEKASAEEAKPEQPAAEEKQTPSEPVAEEAKTEPAETPESEPETTE